MLLNYLEDFEAHWLLERTFILSNPPERRLLVKIVREASMTIDWRKVYDSAMQSMSCEDFFQGLCGISRPDKVLMAVVAKKKFTKSDGINGLEIDENLIVTQISSKEAWEGMDTSKLIESSA